jgi:transcriptional regulator with XRE-family HTH domain
VSTLSNLLNDSNTERLSARRIQALAESKGVRVINTSISKYLRGEPETPSEKVLQAFSVALGIPMTLKQRELVLHTVRVLLILSGCSSTRSRRSRPGVAWSKVGGTGGVTGLLPLLTGIDPEAATLF